MGSRRGRARGVVAVTAIVADADPEVRARAVRTAAVLDGRSGSPWLDEALATRLAADADPRVRAELAVAWCRAGRADDGRRGAGGALRPTIRRHRSPVSAGSHASGGASPVVVDRAVARRERRGRPRSGDRRAGLVRRDRRDRRPAGDGAGRSGPGVRTAAADALRPRSPVPDGVVRTLRGGSAVAQDAALEAIDAEDVAAHDELITWSVGQVVRATHLRHQSALLEAAVAAEEVGDDHAVASASTAFLASLLRRRGQVDRDAAAARALDPRRARGVGLIRRCLHADDVETRAQAIEALEALGDGRLSRAVVRLLDSEPERPTVRHRTSTPSARGLLEDPDGWVRALAIRTLAAHLAVEQRAVGGAGPGRSGPRRALGGGRHPARREPDARDGGDARRAGADAVPARCPAVLDARAGGPPAPRLDRGRAHLHGR